MAKSITKKARSALRDLLRREAAGGIVLMVAAALALIIANSPLGAGYFDLLHVRTGPVLAPMIGPMTVHLWINDALMALFFLYVGLEIKRELIDGQLCSPARRRLPVIAAVAGMVMPALVFLAVTGGDTALRPGWAIPAATDIAFAIGVMALLGKRVPPSLKLFLTTVAIVDDMGAVAIIAVAYTGEIDWIALAGAAGMLLVMAALNRRGVKRLTPYLIAFALLWWLVLLSGAHATVAGVLAAALIPITRSPGAPDAADSPLHRLEHALSPWVAFAIVPLFAFANAGIALGGLPAGVLRAPLVIAVTLGLFFGKQAGIFGGVALAQRLGIAERPKGASWRQLYGVALLAGIGFTMSLFIGGLAFPGAAALQDEVKVGVLLGSLLSAVGGYAVLRSSSIATPSTVNPPKARSAPTQPVDVQP
ncbi:Na+/H+ antiporter NhaA [Sphingomonas sp. H39-1-10]|uniref:Na+/H+ antiporter NhaA n=1 Tax=Sphingomonas TaxID=13687 RepID=UPI0008882A9E|nr:MULTISPECIES: Na+/H+ antiporter NhaA [Sphingomonas]MDF0488035.1 Na+/H+ antiporter NhaA [Sphingomonas pollutisoli]SDA33080.1 Na+:H+ antiporter, NhaA family [Sphingomonas sp. NFR15]